MFIVYRKLNCLLAYLSISFSQTVAPYLRPISQGVGKDMAS